MITLPVALTAQGLKAALPGLLKTFMLCSAVALLVFSAKSVYDDLAENRDKLVATTTLRVQAESKVTTLSRVNHVLQARANEQAETLRASRQAQQALNREFTDIKRQQQAMLGSLRGVQRDLDTKPAVEVEAEANRFMDELNGKLEATYQ